MKVTFTFARLCLELLELVLVDAVSMFELEGLQEVGVLLGENNLSPKSWKLGTCHSDKVRQVAFRPVSS